MSLCDKFAVLVFELRGCASRLKLVCWETSVFVVDVGRCGGFGTFELCADAFHVLYLSEAAVVLFVIETGSI